MSMCDGCGEFDDTRKCELCGQWLCQGCFDPKEKYCNVCSEDILKEAADGSV